MHVTPLVYFQMAKNLFDKEWRDWIRHNVAWGCSKAELFDTVQDEPALAEPTQAQRDDVEDEFKAHTDYFEPYELERFSTPTLGQRSWTFMIYLNEPESGGATSGLSSGKVVAPALALSTEA